MRRLGGGGLSSYLGRSRLIAGEKSAEVIVVTAEPGAGRRPLKQRNRNPLWKQRTKPNQMDRPEPMKPTTKPKGEVRHVIAQAEKESPCEELLEKPVDQHSVSERPGKGSSTEAMTDGNRPVRTRMPGGVGGAGSIPAPTRLGIFIAVADHSSPRKDRGKTGPHQGQASAIRKGKSPHC